MFRPKAPLAETIADESRPLRPSPSIGEILREARLSLGFDLDDVAAALKIKPAYIAALEENRPERLPGRTYAVGFLRAYADLVGLDSAALLRRFRAGTADLAKKADLAFPVPLRTGGMPSLRIVLFGLVLALAGYGSWYYVTAPERVRPRRVGEVPAALLHRPVRQSARAHAGAPVAKPAVAHPPLGAAPKVAVPVLPAVETDNATPAQPPATTPAPPPILLGEIAANVQLKPPALPNPTAAAKTETQARPEPNKAAPQDTAAAAPSDAPASAEAAPISSWPAAPPARPQGKEASTKAAAAQPAASSRQLSAAASANSATPRAITEAAAQGSGVVINATAKSWVQIRDGSGKIIYNHVLKAGDSYAVPQQSGLKLDTGNAGGLTILVGGRRAPALGPSGAVVNAVSLQPKSLLSAPAFHP